jgi:small conductance mechanosensitive channel
MNEQLQTLDQVKSTAIDLAMHFGPKLLVAILILTIGVYVGRWVGRFVHKGLVKFDMEPPVRELLVRILRVLVLGIFLLMALQNLGVELLPLIAGLGVAGAGIALAMQGVLGNLVAGLTIIFTRPFRVGEYVSMLDEEGEVLQIKLFNTVLGHPDLSRVVIPNRKIAGEILHNYGRIRQLEVVVGVAYDTELNAAIAAIHDILQLNPRVLKDPKPMVQVAVLADSSINIGVKPWSSVHDRVDVEGEINKAIVENFRTRGIVIPFPQREVRLLSRAA